MTTLLGITDENLGCACCGRTDLKRYAVIQDNEGEIATYGSDCATKILGRKISTQRNLPKIQTEDIKNITPFVEVTVYKMHISRRYNFVTRSYEWGLTLPVSPKQVLKTLKEDYEYYVEENIQNRPLDAIKTAINLLTEYTTQYA
jgi:hypothetical protein